MQFVMLCEDKPGSEALRLQTREAHLAFVRDLAGTVKLAGPFLSEDGQHMIGSMFILEAESLAAVEKISAGDPYTQAGLFRKVIIHRFRQTVPAPT